MVKFRIDWEGDEEGDFSKWLDNLPTIEHLPSNTISQNSLDRGQILFCKEKQELVNVKTCILCDNKMCPVGYLYDYCHRLELQIQIMYNRFSATHAVFICKKCGAEVFIPKPEAKNKKYCMCRWCKGGRMYLK